MAKTQIKQTGESISPLQIAARQARLYHRAFWRTPITVVVLLAVGVLFFVPTAVFAATLNFSPSAVSRTVGSTLTVTVYVSSPTEAINAVSGTILFPTNLLEVASISKADSILDLWVQEPQFSNTEGTVDVEGVVLNPGYRGSQGTVLKITFRTKSAGQAVLRFSSGAVMANDGSGTNVLALAESGSGAVSIEALPVTGQAGEIAQPAEMFEVTDTQVNDAALPGIPIVTYYPAEVIVGDTIDIQGKANAGVDVEITLLKSGEVVQQKTSRATASGDFVVVFDPPAEAGTYSFDLRAIDEAGNASEESTQFSIIVKEKRLTLLINSILEYLSVTVLIGLASVGVLVTSVFIWYRLLGVIRRMRQESHEAEASLKKSFTQLRKDLQKHLTKLEKGRSHSKLTSKEIAFLKHFEKELTGVEDVISKEVKDISRSE